VEGADVLPLLLEQGDEEVDREHDVLDNVVLLHVDVGDGDTETKNLLELELDGGSDLVDLSGKVLGVGDRGGEFTGLGETGTEKTGLVSWGLENVLLPGKNLPRNLLDQSLGSEESIVLLGELLDELLVLVELLQVLNSHEGELLVELLCSEGYEPCPRDV
jgi:hypothetical protein